MEARVKAVCLSEEKGTTKKVINKGELLENYGLQGDAHAGKWHRQLSLLDSSSIDKMRGQGYELNFGDFAENITTEGLENLFELPVGQQLRINGEILLEITQIGKKCHHDCEIRQTIGDCVMPREGVFARVIKGGEVKAGDKIEIL
ncbi:MOSC domain-containing protein [Halanaerobium saccharolyticum]|jgi:MOSC domain-containing protein YiiM|uniref:MOSC domain-containing protein n=1 Tax=Halanaerobium saccharolyticum TaxID=43595 RepID=A0A2T5RRD8_9FIRM|nr:MULTISPECIES: MOSC domain-containing protein [Halanaerobium]OEG63237.1 MAG: molybdenum cofactor sulfurase [Halanaerobium sp. MDAL1]PTW02714.1 MOSC domain-containing protein [Halanaerobium saccharolyticum]PUU93737.1 MAG: MOSC domain-containing protein [Halanaerobium sp.]TDP96812.1 MOSC domain-containing protein [Halanaerobium saccharolyticum]